VKDLKIAIAIASKQSEILERIGVLADRYPLIHGFYIVTARTVKVLWIRGLSKELLTKIVRQNNVAI
jgi:hypothetical protein